MFVIVPEPISCLMPAPQLMSLLFSIEQAVVAIARKRPRMTDKDAEAVFVSYRQFFQDIRQGKDVDDPYSTILYRQEMLNEIWEVLVYRERQRADAEHINGSFRTGPRPITSYEELYVMAFNELRKSARSWRKRGGKKAYLKHIEEHLRDTLGDDHQFFHGKVSDDESHDQAHPTLRFDWLAETHGIQLTLEANRVLPEDVTEEQAIYHKSFQRNPAAHVERLREIHEDLPEYPQLTNDLIGALFAAGLDEEAQATADKMVTEHPDYLFGVSQYLRNTNDGEKLRSMAHLLGPDRQITHFTTGTGGAYHLQEFVAYEGAAINVFCAERNYADPIRRIERVMELGLPPQAMLHAAQQVALLHFGLLAKEAEEGLEGTLPSLPPEVEGAAGAVDLVRRVYEELLEGMGRG